MSDGFFVVGFSRSGTTLLSVLLDRHSRLCVPPETAFYDEIAPQIREGDADDLAKILRDWRRLPELTLRPADVIARLPAAWRGRDVLAAILELYAAGQGKARWGEKTPQHLHHVPAILRDFPGAKIFCMVRDGREAVLSLRAMPWFRGSLATAARQWTKSIELAERFAEEHPGRFLLVRYESLVAAPADVLSPVLQFLGEELEEGQFEPATPSSVVLPRSMQWKGDALGPIDADRVGRRRATARAGDLAFLERVMRDELQRHGYGS